MPQELPPLPFGDVAKYKLARKGSGLSDEELLEEQAGVERRIAKKAALRGVTLIGAAVVKQRNASLRERAVSSAASAASVSADASVSSATAVSSAASTASVSADASLRERAASVSSAASLRERAAAVSSTVSSAAAVYSDAAVSADVSAYSSRGRPLRERKLWSEDDD